ncbi:protein D2-like [Anastrepha ludens]|uniref:protein D2-like n=1 Tax=Anastrepha ludens TaxID=28586 RepID=UPI0023B0281F|nr:protein D2-like [Anastrepha ludens]XP_053946673.1 protein D2-like [Anastrepha ludens]
MSNFKTIKALCFLCIMASIKAKESSEVKHIFELLEVVPDVIPSAPNQFLKVTYDNALEVQPGAELTPTQVKSQPLVEWAADHDAFYTLIMTDPDAPSRREPTFREFKHWLVGNIPGNDISQGEVLAAYVGSGPPQGTGLHRYVFLLYKQAGKLEFLEERVGNNSRNGRPKFRAAGFAEKYGLGEPVAANFYQAQWDEYVPTVHKQLSGN